MTDEGHEQRLTKRVQADLPMEWWATERRVLRRRQIAVPARILNVSASGIALRSAPNPDVMCNMIVPFRCRGIDGEMRIRRIEETDDPAELLYAAELVEPSRELMEVLLGATEMAPRRTYELIWNRGD